MIKHAFLEGFKNIARSFWLSATAISVLTVSLGSVALVATLATVVGFSVRQLDRQISIVAYFNEDVSSETIQQVQNDLKKESKIKEISFINREEAQKRLSEQNQVASELITSLKQSNIDNFALEYLEIVPINSESYIEVENLLRSDTYQGVFFDVRSAQSFIQNLQRVYNWIRIVGIALVGIFGLISILVMVNILRIAIYSYRDEIEIMRLVGATNNYIRAPFIAEGAYFNLFAAAIVVILFIPSLNALIPTIENWLQIRVETSSLNLLSQIYFSLTLTILVGIVVGVGTSYVATQRYLKL